MTERMMHGLRVSGRPIDPRRESHWNGGGPADRVDVSIDGKVTANRIEYKVSVLLRLYFWTDLEDEHGAKLSPHWKGQCGEIYISRTGGGEVTEGGRKAIWKLLDAISEEHCDRHRSGPRLIAKAEAACSTLRMANRSVERAGEQLREAQAEFEKAEAAWRDALHNAGIDADSPDGLAMVAEY